MLPTLLPVIPFSQLGPCKNRTSVSEEGITLRIRGVTYTEDTPSRKYLEFVIMPHLLDIGLGDNINIHLPGEDDPGEGWCVGKEKTKGLLVGHVKPLRAPLRAFNFGRREAILRLDALGLIESEQENPDEELEFAAQYEFDIFDASSEYHYWYPYAKLSTQADSYHLLPTYSRCSRSNLYQPGLPTRFKVDVATRKSRALATF
ncbi:hypothetical protein K491DRAFT_715639 [Lophiostoma macrostomum CBS 122681]|uniref:Uncharacterized protein n=1 Tax=Lophiostoma macrostomum CBS 122681 TaxID=1314788 RepID=A0A6A6TA23_9PLEO|nr:hypothetical protein K491DRAFT_715639 [Lophiostoma macrostomum CBS 122681]